MNFFLLFLALSFLLPLISCSLGDSAWTYRHCRADCSHQCLNSPVLPSSAAGGFLSSSVDSSGRHLVSVRRPLNSYLAFLGWDCDGECQYRCMRAIHESESAAGLEAKKYHGKWPFQRLFGLQEFFSTLFSCINAVPHIVLGIKYYRAVPKFYSLFWYWMLFSLVGLNTWVWSAAFHARDTPVTEKLDYYSAWLGILYAGICFIIRVFSIRQPIHRLALINLFAFIFISHVSYMQFISFDYGWNMIVTAGSGIAFSVFVIIWGLNSGLPHARRLAIAYSCLVVFSLLEIFDFPPLFDLLDSHAIWHGLTPPIGFAMWNFALEDANYQLNAGIEVENKREKYSYSRIQ